MTSGSLWNYYGDGKNDNENEIDDNGNKTNNNSTITSTFFKYKKNLIGGAPNNTSRLNAEIVAPLKYLSNFWRSLDLSLINCEIEPDLR